MPGRSAGARRRLPHARPTRRRAEPQGLPRRSHPVERSALRDRLRPGHIVQREVLRHALSPTLDGLRRDDEDVSGKGVTGTEIEEPYSELRITRRSLST